MRGLIGKMQDDFDAELGAPEMGDVLGEDTSAPEDLPLGEDTSGFEDEPLGLEELGEPVESPYGGEDDSVFDSAPRVGPDVLVPGQLPLEEAPASVQDLGGGAPPASDVDSAETMNLLKDDIRGLLLLKAQERQENSKQLQDQIYQTNTEQ